VIYFKYMSQIIRLQKNMKLKIVLTTVAVLDLLLLSNSLPSVTEKKSTLWTKDKEILASGSDDGLKHFEELQSQEEENRRGRQYCQAGLKAKHDKGVECYYCACRSEPGFDNCFKVDVEWCRQQGIPDDQPSGGGGSKPPSSTSSQGTATVIYCNPCTIVTTNEI